MTAYDVARRVTAPEFGRLLQSATASGVLTDDTRREVMSSLPENATGQQVLTALRILRIDAANRKKSYSDQLGLIRDAFKTGGVDMDTTSTPSAPGGAGEVNPYKPGTSMYRIWANKHGGKK